VEIRLVAPIDRVQGVMRGQVGHGEPARHDDVVVAGEGQDIDGDDVPVRYLICAGRWGSTCEHEPARYKGAGRSRGPRTQRVKASVPLLRGSRVPHDPPCPPGRSPLDSLPADLVSINPTFLKPSLTETARRRM